MSAGARLRAALDQLAPALGRAGAELWTGRGGVAGYRRWLRTSYQIVRATEPLIGEAVAECARRADPLSAALAPYLVAHLDDEHGHDGWLLEDYAAAGGDPERLRLALPSGAVARFAGAPWYWIRQVHPLALLGHIALLEWYPPPVGAESALAERTGLPPAAFRTLREHSALDAGHGDRLTTFLDSLDLDPAGRRLLLTTAVTSAGGLADVVAELLGHREPEPRATRRRATQRHEIERHESECHESQRHESQRHESECHESECRATEPVEEPWPTWTTSSAWASTSAAPPRSSSPS